jgi:hypothetical protein
MEPHDLIMLIAYPLSGVIGILLSRLWVRRSNKVTETAAYVSEAFDGWSQLTHSQGKQLARMESELHQLRSEVIQLRMHQALTGCNRGDCSIRIPVSIAGPPGPAGEQGIRGEHGTQGRQGVRGTQGTQGAQGTQGIKGSTGPAGHDWGNHYQEDD